MRGSQDGARKEESKALEKARRKGLGVGKRIPLYSSTPELGGDSECLGLLNSRHKAALDLNYGVLVETWQDVVLRAVPFLWDCFFGIPQVWIGRFFVSTCFASE